MMSYELFVYHSGHPCERKQDSVGYRIFIDEKPTR